MEYCNEHNIVKECHQCGQCEAEFRAYFEERSRLYDAECDRLGQLGLAIYGVYDGIFV